MALDVEVNLSLEQSSSGVSSFGMPLFVCADAVTANEAAKKVEYTECTALSDVVSAGFNKESKMYKAVQLFFSQTNHPKKFAVYGGTSEDVVTDADEWSAKGWRQLITVNLGTSKIEDVARLVEGLNKKMYFVSATIEGADAKTDADFKTAWETLMGTVNSYERTVLMYYDNSVATPEAALVAETAGRDVGSFTYKNMILKGVPPLDISDARVNIINGNDEAGHAMTIVRKAGDIVTTEGKTASGEYIDVIDSRDWIIENITYNSQSALNKNAKIPYTNAGITLLESITLSVLKEGFDMGMIAPLEEDETTGDYSTDFAPASEISPESKASRHYDGGHFSFVLAGAIHTAEISGTITV